MASRIGIIPLALTWVSAGLFIACPALAQKDHPAAGVAMKYLRLMALQEFEAAVKLIQPNSLEDLKRDQVNYLKSAPTIADEEAMLRRLGVADITAVERMPAAQAFVMHSRARYTDDEESRKLLAQLGTTLKTSVIGVVKESPEMVHVCIRSNHRRKDQGVSTLDLVSVVKMGKSWKISLDAQEPTFVLKKEEEK